MPRVYCAVKSLIVDSGKFLIIKQRIGGKEVWDLPGGRVKFGSDPIGNLRREILEEVGIKVKIDKPIGVWYFYRL